MRILIVDDEPLARLRLRSLLDELARQSGLAWTCTGEAADAETALAAVAAAPPDLVLLDIRLPGAGSNAGLRLAASLRAMASPPAVIFVTAHAEHALRAFELDATDYLTKPVRRERLLAALQRVQVRQAPTVPPLAPATPLAAPALVVHARGRVLRVPLSEVLYLRAEQKYVTLRTATESHLLDESLAELSPALEGSGVDFIRIHRNALVARHAIQALAPHPDEHDSDGWAVRIAPLDEWLSVSRRQLSAVRAALLEITSGAAP